MIFDVFLVTYSGLSAVVDGSVAALALYTSNYLVQVLLSLYDYFCQTKFLAWFVYGNSAIFRETTSLLDCPAEIVEFERRGLNLVRVPRTLLREPASRYA